MNGGISIAALSIAILALIFVARGNLASILYRCWNAPKYLSAGGATVRNTARKLDARIDRVAERVEKTVTSAVVRWGARLRKLRRRITFYYARRRIEGLFQRVRRGEAEPHQLKLELDRWSLFHQYEDRFLGLFRKTGRARRGAVPVSWDVRGRPRQRGESKLRTAPVLAVGLAIIIGIWLLMGIHSVAPEERGLVREFAKEMATASPAPSKEGEYKILVGVDRMLMYRMPSTPPNGDGSGSNNIQVIARW